MGLVFAGAVTGMMVMGYLADVIGRRKAMIFTLSLTVAGSVRKRKGKMKKRNEINENSEIKERR